MARETLSGMPGSPDAQWVQCQQLLCRSSHWQVHHETLDHDRASKLSDGIKAI